MQFQVPQFIEVEDKVIGPLSLRQFGFIAAPALLGFLLYLFVETWVWLIIAAPLIGLGTALAFVRISGRTLFQIIVSAFNFYWRPQTFVWQPERPNLPKNEETIKEAVKEAAGASGSAGFSLESLFQGMALKNAWAFVQTGSRATKEEAPRARQKPGRERYQVFTKIGGERRVARRMDYR